MPHTPNHTITMRQHTIFIYIKEKEKRKTKKKTDEEKTGCIFLILFILCMSERLDRKTERLERAAINFIFESIDVLMVTGEGVLAVLDEETESPDPQRRFAVLLDHVEMRIIRAASRFANLANDRIHAL